MKEVEEEVVKEEEVDGNHWVASNKLTHHCNDQMVSQEFSLSPSLGETNKLTKQAAF